MLKVLGERADGATMLGLGGGLACILKGRFASPAVDVLEIERLGVWLEPTDHVSLNARVAFVKQLEQAQMRPLASFALDGTSEGASKGWETRKGSGAADATAKAEAATARTTTGLGARVRNAVGKALAIMRENHREAAQAHTTAAGLHQQAGNAGAAARHTAAAATHQKVADDWTEPYASPQRVARAASLHESFALANPGGSNQHGGAYVDGGVSDAQSHLNAADAHDAACAAHEACIKGASTAKVARSATTTALAATVASKMSLPRGSYAGYGDGGPALREATSSADHNAHQALWQTDQQQESAANEFHTLAADAHTAAAAAHRDIASQMRTRQALSEG